MVNSIIDCLVFLLSSTLNVCSLGEAKRVGDCFLHAAPMALLHIQVGFHLGKSRMESYDQEN